jgi:hypothetical protein
VGETSKPSLASSPQIRRWPQRGFSRASRSTSSRTSAGSGGRPRRTAGCRHFRRTSVRCQRRSVRGVTRSTPCEERGCGSPEFARKLGRARPVPSGLRARLTFNPPVGARWPRGVKPFRSLARARVNKEPKEPVPFPVRAPRLGPRPFDVPLAEITISSFLRRKGGRDVTARSADPVEENRPGRRAALGVPVPEGWQRLEEA